MHSKAKHSTQLIVIITVILLAPTVSCTKSKLEIIENTDIRTLPSLTVKDYTTQYSDSGILDMKLSAPIMESYNEADPTYTEFREGIKVIFYDGKSEPSATVNAKYAKLTESKSLWELRDSVVIYSDNGSTLETEQLFWEQSESVDKIYTDRFVTIKSEDQTIMGHGFESDSRLTRRKIKKVTATIYVSNEQQE